MTTYEWTQIFAERLNRMKKEKHMTLKNIADASGVSIESLSKYRRGETIPRADMVVRIAKALNCSTSDLLEVDEPLL